MSIPDSLIMSVLGLSVVFVGLFSIFLLIKIMSFVVTRVQNAKTSKAPASEAAAPSAAAAPAAKPHVGVDLIGVEPKEAACIMAIVSDTCGIPLNELRFLSIKAL